MSQDSEVGAVLDRAPKLEKSYGKLMGAVLTWKALSSLRPRNLLVSLFLSICFAAAGAYWQGFRW